MYVNEEVVRVGEKRSINVYRNYVAKKMTSNANGRPFEQFLR